MKKHSDRGAHHAERVQLSLARELAELFRDEIADPLLEDLQVLDVQLSKDGRNARVHVAVPTERDSDAVTSALTRATPFLRASVASALSLERTPELRFVIHPRGHAG
jgi:ribosome-binding factor A